MKKNNINNKANVNPLDKKTIAPDRIADPKQKAAHKKSSVIVPDVVRRSAVNQVKANSSRDVRGSGGLANTGTIITYED